MDGVQTFIFKARAVPTLIGSVPENFSEKLIYSVPPDVRF